MVELLGIIPSPLLCEPVKRGLAPDRIEAQTTIGQVTQFDAQSRPKIARSHDSQFVIHINISDGRIKQRDPEMVDPSRSTPRREDSPYRIPTALNKFHLPLRRETAVQGQFERLRGFYALDLLIETVVTPREFKPRIYIFNRTSDRKPHTHLTELYIPAYSGVMSKPAGVALNKKVTFLANDKAHKKFKMACLEDDREMAEVLREYMRDYLKQRKAKK